MTIDNSFSSDINVKEILERSQRSIQDSSLPPETSGNESFGLTDEEDELLEDKREKAIADSNRKYGYGDGNSDGNGNGKGKKKSKRPITAYKYSRRFMGNLYEAVILNGQPVFLTYDPENYSITVVKSIQETNRSIKPPDSEEYPYDLYEFASVNEVMNYAEVAKQETMDSLYDRAKHIVQIYNDQDPYKQTLLAADIVWSYFQDKFSTTHYLGVVGDNGSGKSTIGDTFEAVGYRPVSMTDPSAANLFRVLGTLEPGQCTIIADEAEKIDQSSDIMSILKTGYHIKKKVAKTNSNTWKQEFYWTYGFKIIITEKSLHPTNAKGVLDRTFTFNTYKGEPKHDIKEILNPQGNKERQRLLDELTNFRKLLLIYRLIHFKDPISDIDIGIDGRDKELCKPLLQLFYNNKAQKEIEDALQKLIEAKNQRKESTIEAALYPIIANSISEYGNEISASTIWELIKSNLEGRWDERKPNEYQTSEYGTIYRNSITNIICDKLGAKRKHKETGNVLIFNPEKVVRAGKLYNRKVNIRTKLINSYPEGSEGSEGFVKVLDNPSIGDNVESKDFSNKQGKNSQECTRNDINILQLVDSRNPSISLEHSGLSEPADIIRQERILRRIGHTDNWECQSCVFTGDKHFMKVHTCSSTKRKH